MVLKVTVSVADADAARSAQINGAAPDIAEDRVLLEDAGFI